MLIRSVLCLVSCFVVKGNILYESLMVQSRPSPIAVSLKLAIDSYSFRNSRTLIVSTFATSEREKQHQAEIVQEVLSQGIDKVSLLIETELSLEGPYPRLNNLILLDTASKFDLILERSGEGVFDYSGYYMIAVTDPSEDHEEDVKKIISACWKHSILAVHIFINDRIYKYEPYTEKLCTDLTPILVRTVTWGSTGSLEEPGDIKNFYKCPIRVAVWDNPPYTILKRNMDKSLSVEGVEGMFVNLLAEKLNFTFEVVEPTGLDLRGFLHANGVAAGATGMVINKTVDFACSAFTYTERRGRYMSPSSDCLYTHLVIVVPAAKELLPLARGLYSYKVYAWIAINIVSFFALLTILIIKFTRKSVRNFVFGRNNKTPVLNLIVICFGGVVVRTPARNFARTLLVMFILYCFVLRTINMSQLFRTLQQSIPTKHIESVEEILSKNMKLYADDITFNFYDEYPEYQEFLEFTREPMIDLVQNLTNPNFNGAVLTTTGQISYFYVKHRSQKHFVVLRVPKIMVTIKFMFQKHSPLRHVFNRQILVMLSSGFVSKWIREILPQKFLKPEPNWLDEPKPLEFDNLQGCFQLFIICILIAAVVFCLELIWHRIVNLKILHKLIRNH